MSQLDQAFKKWCKETKRSGGVLVGSSIKEFFQYYDTYKPEPEEVAIEERVLIGHLNRKMGWNGYKPLEIGTAIYEKSGLYMADMVSIDGTKIFEQKWYKETLKPAIDFTK